MFACFLSIIYVSNNPFLCLEPCTEPANSPQETQPPIPPTPTPQVQPTPAPEPQVLPTTPQESPSEGDIII